jgi:uncharacterized protein YdaU (DUF1376 family)
MNTFYFSHDYTARSDIKIKKLIATQGMLGYGIYWSLVEDLYHNNNKLEDNPALLAYDYRCTTELIKSVINDFDLFIVKDGYVSSNSIQKRLDERNDKVTKAKQSASKRWENKAKNADNIETQCDPDANAMRTQCDGNAIKEIKVNKRKVKEEVVFIPPILNDVLVYFDENGYSKEAATKAFNYYTNLGWKNSKGNQVINWKNTMQNWFTPENEKKKYHLYPKLMN